MWKKFNNSCVKAQTSERKKRQDTDEALIAKLTQDIFSISITYRKHLNIFFKIERTENIFVFATVSIAFVILHSCVMKSE